MRYWVDSEFQDDGRTITLISIGIVASDGRELYAQSVEFDLRNGSDWVWENVYPHLEVCPYKPSELDRVFCCKHKQGQCTVIPEGEPYNRCPWRTREQLKQDILTFLNVERYGKPEIWTYYGAYDHVAFCQLFGTMMDLPQGFPMYTRDIKQWCDQLGNPQLLEQGNLEHHALADARWNKKAWEFLAAYERGRTQVVAQLARDQHAYLLEIVPHSYQEGKRASHLREQWQVLGLGEERTVHG